MNKVDCIVLFFCRAPDQGKVKTRLARQIGEEKALQVYSYLLDLNLSLVSDIQFAEVGIVTTKPDHAYFKSWQQFGLEIAMQVGDGLGEKLANAFSAALKKAEKVILLGTDSPDMSVDHLRHASDALNDHDAVITPVQDGGYILIGLKRLESGLFENIDWSTERVFQQTISAMETAGLKFAVMETLRDVDEPEDLEGLEFYTELEKELI
jgi:rSAM/selenodomain-associated transferase 1